MNNREKKSDSDRAKFGVALGVLVLLVGGAGAGFRVLDRHLTRPSDATPLPAGTLEQIPQRIGAWTGRDVPVEERIREATDTDDLLNRQYVRGGGDAVALYVAYGIQARDLMPHRPEVCYPSAGWSFLDSEYAELPLVEGETLPCRVLHFSRGGFDNRKITVVNYYIVDGKYCADVSLLRSKAWWGSRGVRHMVQVQIACATAALGDQRATEASARNFAAASAGAIHQVLSLGEDHAGVSARSGKTRPEEAQ